MIWNRVLIAAMAASVAVAFADSSIVVLALPELYVALDTSIVGISWVITAYNLVVFIATFALLPVARRVRPAPLVLAGLVVFLAASIACGFSDGLTFLIAARAVQGLGGAHAPGRIAPAARRAVRARPDAGSPSGRRPERLARRSGRRPAGFSPSCSTGARSSSPRRRSRRSRSAGRCAASTCRRRRVAALARGGSPPRTSRWSSSSPRSSERCSWPF